MLVNKVTTGFVIQVFDTELKRFVSQEFVAGDDCQYEDGEGEPVSSEALEVDGKETYLPFDMVQPPPGAARTDEETPAPEKTDAVPPATVVLGTHSTDPDFNGDCDYAVVRLTPELVGVSGKWSPRPDAADLAAAVERLASKAESAGIQPEELDEMVHELASSVAADVNNGGLEDQIRYLVEGLGAKYAERQLDDLIEDHAEGLEEGE